ncbi:hypothetical protein OH77DRAFT_1423951 [Trametes cingulata]|nr:hypothetical protein OH77DRAFT_1423951 [Trametes cingulata]
MALEDDQPPSGTPAAAEALLALGGIPQPQQDTGESDSDDARWSPFYGITAEPGSDEMPGILELEAAEEVTMDGQEAAHSSDVVTVEDSDHEGGQPSTTHSHPGRSFAEVVLGDLETCRPEYSFMTSGSSPEVPIKGLLLARAENASESRQVSGSGLKITLPPLSKLGKASTSRKASSSQSPLPARKQRKSPVKKGGPSRPVDRDPAARRLGLKKQYKRQKGAHAHQTAKSSVESGTRRRHLRAPIPDLAAAADLFYDVTSNAAIPPDAGAEPVVLVVVRLSRLL